MCVYGNRAKLHLGIMYMVAFQQTTLKKSCLSETTPYVAMKLVIEHWVELLC